MIHPRRTMPNMRNLFRAVALAAALTAAPVLAQTATTVPMPTGAFSLPPSADPVTSTPSMTFDVTSVRETERTNGAFNMGIVFPPGTGQFDASYITLAILTQTAFSAGSTFQISGGPDWLTERYFHVQGKSDHSVDEALAKLPIEQQRMERLHMLQALLADRFHMKAHWETREGSVLNLVVAKNGLKMQPTKLPPPVADRADGSSSSTANQSTGVHARGGPQGIEIDGGRFNARAISLMINSLISMPIIDKTGLPPTAYYDFALQFSRTESATPAPDAYPSLFTALEEELGLKLEPAKGPVDTLVIDHAEAPSEN